MDSHVLNTIDASLIGQRLADARRARGLTQEQVAAEVGVARTTVVAMEKGERRPRAGELVKLAGLFGRPVADFVQVYAKSAPPDFIVQFRAAASVKRSDADSRRNLDTFRFQQLCRWYVELEELLGAPLPRRYPDQYDISTTPAEQAAEEVASSERNRLGLGDGPVGNLWGIFESDVGLRVFAIPMSDRRTAGMFIYSEEYGGCIAVNAHHPEERRRWSAAHEYAHFLTNRFAPEITLLTSGRKLRENARFADAFAREFLMPSSGLRRRFESVRRAKDQPITPADVLALAHLYQVSFQAMTLRLEILRLLKLGTWEKLDELGFKPKKARELIYVPE